MYFTIYDDLIHVLLVISCQYNIIYICLLFAMKKHCLLTNILYSYSRSAVVHVYSNEYYFLTFIKCFIVVKSHGMLQKTLIR